MEAYSQYIFPYTRLANVVRGVENLHLRRGLGRRMPAGSEISYDGRHPEKTALLSNWASLIDY